MRAQGLKIVETREPLTDDVCAEMEEFPPMLPRCERCKRFLEHGQQCRHFRRVLGPSEANTQYVTLVSRAEPYRVGRCRADLGNQQMRGNLRPPQFVAPPTLARRTHG